MRNLIVLFFLPMCLYSQVRMIPHVTRDGGGFSTTVILLNASAQDQSYTLHGYSSDGVNAPPISGSLAPGEKLESDAFDLFQNRNVASFTIEADDTVRASVSYRSLGADSGPAHVLATENQDFDWIIYNGSWSVTWDGFALVNMGSAPTSVSVNRIDATGAVTDSVELDDALPSFGKLLYVLSSDFAQNDDGYFQIVADQPVSMMALRGNLESTFLWENRAAPGSASRGKCKWEQRKTGADARLLDLTWDGSRFLAAGGKALLSSPDGLNWSESEIEGSIFTLGIASNGSRIVSVGAGGDIRFSDDASSWTAIDSGTPAPLNDVVWNGSQFLLVGDVGTMLTSPDGETWTRQNPGLFEFLFSAQWLGDSYVVVGDKGTILTSPDGENWTIQDSGVDMFLRDVAFNGSVYVAVGDQGAILSSPDGINWELINKSVSETLRDVHWDGSSFVAVGDQGALLNSVDGLSWNYGGLCTLETLCALASNGQVDVAAGEGGSVLVREP